MRGVTLVVERSGLVVMRAAESKITSFVRKARWSRFGAADHRPQRATDPIPIFQVLTGRTGGASTDAPKTFVRRASSACSSVSSIVGSSRMI